MKNAFLLVLALSGILTASTATAQLPCDTWTEGTEVATFEDQRLDESSGLAVSWRNPGLLWNHNDSGDDPRLFVTDEQGRQKTLVTLPSAGARDWEDMAIGPCSADDPTPCVYVADFGDNDSVRPSVQIHIFAEPDLSAEPALLEVADVTTLDFTYDGGARNAEALLVHPQSARIVVVEKVLGQPSRISEVPRTAPFVAAQIGTIDLNEMALSPGLVTGGDYAPDGLGFSIRTYSHVFTFCGATVEEALGSEPSRVIALDTRQGETLAYARDGRALWTTSENLPAPLIRMELVGDEPQADAGGTPDLGTPTPDSGPGVDPDAADSGVVVVIDDPKDETGCRCGTVGSPRSAQAGLAGLLLGMMLFVRTRRR